MSLAYFAASIDDENNITMPNNNDIINQKRHKKTQRKYSKIEPFDNQKVNSVLQQIHNNDDDEEDDMNQIKFPPNPESMGSQKTIPKVEGFKQSSNVLGKPPMPTYDGTNNLDLNDYGNYGDQQSSEEYYKKILPGYLEQKNNSHVKYPQTFSPYYSNTHNNNSSDDVLMQKLNYMISLLEEQQDEKTNNVTEEVILYSFLGIFIIFIADSFVRAGKYTR